MHAQYHVPAEAFESGAAAIRDSPKDTGVLQLIVRRPDVGLRELPQEAQLDQALGLVGDSWPQRSSARTADGGPHPDMQLTLMNARCAALVAGHPDRWSLAGDQLFADLDLSTANLPAGSRLRVGEAVIEITDQPHTGCTKFKERFGEAALVWVNTPAGRDLRLRGANARIVTGGVIRIGDAIVKV